LRLRTSGGRHSFAWRRRTEKPPWVLVSDGVRILQKECTTGLGVSGRGGSGNVGRFTCCKKGRLFVSGKSIDYTVELSVPKRVHTELLCLQNHEACYVCISYHSTFVVEQKSRRATQNSGN
jgi:hypothetical protein